jgi:hypothetical protein
MAITTTINLDICGYTWLAPILLYIQLSCMSPWAINGYSNSSMFIICTARRLGFMKSPPAYLSLTPLTNLDLLKCRVGANYASGGSGILNTTVCSYISCFLDWDAAHKLCIYITHIIASHGDRVHKYIPITTLANNYW